MKTATQMATRSPQADAIHFAALRYIDELDGRQNPGPLRGMDWGNTYTAFVGREVHRLMREELEPIQQAIVLATCLQSRLDEIEIPPTVKELRESIIARWAAVARELLS